MKERDNKKRAERSLISGLLGLETDMENREKIYIRRARGRAAELWDAVNRLQREYREGAASYKNQMEQIRKGFDKDGQGIFYLLQQMGGSCFGGEGSRRPEETEKYLTYLLESLRTVWDKMEAGVQPRVSAPEWNALDLDSPVKEGYSGKILLEYLDIITRATAQLNLEMSQARYAEANYRFYEKLWLSMEPFMEDLKAIEAEGEERGEQLGFWYRRAVKMLERCGVRIVFYEDAEEEEQKKWFLVKEEAENIPAVIRTEESGAGYYEYSLGSFPKGGFRGDR